MSIHEEVKNSSVGELIEKYPFITTYLSNNALDDVVNKNVTLAEYINNLDDEEQEDRALDANHLTSGLATYIVQMLSFLGEDDKGVDIIEILPGTDKSGNPENFEKLSICKNEVICIVGPTGSGKSRLLADIEWVAQGDTPTGRNILINHDVPDPKWRFSTSDKLVAQLSQNMNFVMDLSVEEFITLHAESRMVENPKEIINKIIVQANDLAGEKFDKDTPITALSGGQSRALMIADTAILSTSPIVLIDEIENAGIDRKRALKLLLNENKIVLMATHDPVLALMGDRRIVIKNGGIHKVIETKENERSLLGKIEELDNKVQNMRTLLRAGESLEKFEF